MFTKQHYEAIARVIAEVSFFHDIDYVHIANGFDEVFRSYNNKYKSETFYGRIKQIIEKKKNEQARRGKSQ
jgi:hypothetical protein